MRWIEIGEAVTGRDCAAIIWGETALNDWYESIPRLVRALEAGDMPAEYGQAEVMLDALVGQAGPLAYIIGMSLTELVDVACAVVTVLAKNGRTIGHVHLAVGVRQLLQGVPPGD